jgi:hypothetical protein
VNTCFKLGQAPAFLLKGHPGPAEPKLKQVFTFIPHSLKHQAMAEKVEKKPLHLALTSGVI